MARRKIEVADKSFVGRSRGAAMVHAAVEGNVAGIQRR